MLSSRRVMRDAEGSVRSALRWARRWWRLTAFACFTSVAAASAVLLAAPGVVTTHGGLQFEGDVTERTSDVIVSIRGVQTIVHRDEVASIRYTGGFAKQFADRLAALDDGDVTARIELARWAIQQEQYMAAREALNAALAIDANSAEALELDNVVRSQLRLQAKSGNLSEATEQQPARRDGAAPGDAPTLGDPGRATGLTGVSAAVAIQRRLLSPEHIQSVRRIEWRPGDVVRVRVDPEEARRFAEEQNRPWRSFVASPQGVQAEAILTLGSEDRQRRGVQILSDPPVVAEFRRLVQPLLLNGCAASGCHGPVNPAGRFVVVSPADTEAATYTNFYLLMTEARLLESTPPAGGIFGGAAEVRMVERSAGRASRSLLLQYMLSPEVAEFDHPQVQGYQPLFQSMSDPRARSIVAWINALHPKIPEYGFRFVPGQGVTQPTTQPAK